MNARHLSASLAAASILALTACGSSSSSSPSSTAGSGATSGSSSTSTSGSTDTAAAGDAVPVVVGFYPLAFLAERIGGTHVKVTNLTKPGAEPHDLELTPKEVAQAGQARVGIYVKGMQKAVDSAFATSAPKTVVDVAPSADLSLKFSPTAVGEAEEETAAGATDPHFWLDPKRYSAVAATVEKALAQTDPAHAADFTTNLAALQKELGTLDTSLTTGLKNCARKDVVTSHAAFGYLTQRYGLKQISIAGLSPEEEPEPKKLAAIAKYAKEHKVTTIYTETLASPAIAKTVASETGATTATLDPIEGVSGSDTYLTVMAANLAALKKGQSCS